MTLALSLQEMSDRMEIQELLTDYSHALDSRDWAGLRSLFTDDAVIDYTAMGGPHGGPDHVVDWLRETMHHMLGYQHLVATSKIALDGDGATGRTICFNPMVLDVGRDGTPARHVFFCGLWYVDRFVRTRSGWKIAERREERSYFYNFPGGEPPLPGGQPARSDGDPPGGEPPLPRRTPR